MHQLWGQQLILILILFDNLLLYRSKNMHTVKQQLQQCINKNMWAIENGSKISKNQNKMHSFLLANFLLISMVN